MIFDWTSLLVGIVVGGATSRLFLITKKKNEANSNLSTEALIHEIKTPLTGLSWILNSLGELTLGDQVSDETIGLIKEGKKKVGNSLELANDALFALNTSPDYSTFKFEKHDISDAIKCVIDENSFTAKERFINITFAKIATVPPFNFDEIKITLAIRNLVNNAVKYSPSHGSVDVTLSRDGDDATIIVQDRGIGIPEADMAKISNKFFRATNTGDTPGSGLGLFIVKNIVSGHHGRIDIQSKEGIGTKITLFLPIK